MTHIMRISRPTRALRHRLGDQCWRETPPLLGLARDSITIRPSIRLWEEQADAMHENIQAFYDRKYIQGSELPRTSKQYTIDCVPNGASLDILDVGCGSGANSVALAAKG